jgi:hypothetical protein
VRGRVPEDLPGLVVVIWRIKVEEREGNRSLERSVEVPELLIVNFRDNDLVGKRGRDAFGDLERRGLPCCSLDFGTVWQGDGDLIARLL